MTREEAISVLKNTAWIGTDKKVGEVEKAIMMAIEALKAQIDKDTNVPINDCISRQAAIDAIKGLPTWWADEGGYYGGAQPPMEALLDPEDAVSAIENLPSAQPVLDRTKISDLLEKIYSIQSVHLSVEGVLARKYYCKQLWIELFGSEDVPKWID